MKILWDTSEFLIMPTKQNSGIFLGSPSCHFYIKNPEATVNSMHRLLHAFQGFALSLMKI